MKLKNVFMMPLIFTLILLSINSLSAQEKRIDKKDLPKEALTSFHKNYPNAIIKGASLEKEHGKTYYEIESRDGSHHRDILYTERGKVAELEESLASSDIPDFVKSSVMKKYPSCEINKAEKVTSGNKISYELIVQTGMQKDEVVLDSKGNIKKMEKMKKENEEGKENGEGKEDND
jgi:Putative beta-lactamase-inhibitor-like, PepSY-like